MSTKWKIALCIIGAIIGVIIIVSKLGDVWNTIAVAIIIISFVLGILFFDEQHKNTTKHNDKQVSNKEIVQNEKDEGEERITIDDIDFENLSYEKAKDGIEYVKSHSKLNFPKYVKKLKETKDEAYGKDISETLRFMYIHNDKVLLQKDTNGKLGFISVENQPFLSIYTQPKLVPEEFKKHMQTITIREAFDIFYAANEKSGVKGIVFNYKTESEIGFKKKNLDDLKIDTVFDVSWKKKK